MKKIVSFIPNLLTMGNLVCGCIAIVLAFEHNFVAAFWAIVVAAVFDFLDGFSARLLKAFSPLGGQLDSLSDMVSFGVAPTMVMFNFLAVNNANIAMVQYSAFLLAIGAALRLAKFNIDPSQSDKFIGVPSPAMALFMASFVQIPYMAQIGPAVVVFFAYAMVCKYELFALKFKDFSIKNNAIKYVFLILSVTLIVIFGVYAAPTYIVLLYILMSVATRKR